MSPVSNASLHRIQGRLRDADRMVHALIYGPINQPQSWTAQDLEVLLVDCLADIRSYGSDIHDRWLSFYKSDPDFETENYDAEAVLGRYLERENAR